MSAAKPAEEYSCLYLRMVGSKLMNILDQVPKFLVDMLLFACRNLRLGTRKQGT